MPQLICEVVNQKGMHARAAARIVSQVVTFNSEVTLTHGSRVAPGDSLIKLLTLNAPKGSLITINSEGEDAEAVLHSLEQLFSDGFGE